MQVLSGAIGRERLHVEAPPRDQLEEQLQAFLNWIASPPEQLDGLLRGGLAGAQQAFSSRALGITAQILRKRESYSSVLERCQRGDLDVTSWLSWLLGQLTASAATHGAVIDAVERKAAFWWNPRHSGNNRQ